MHCINIYATFSIIFLAKHLMVDTRRLIGRKFDDEVVQRYIKHYPFKIVPSSDSGNDRTPMILVTYKGHEMKLEANDISTMILVKLKEVAEAYLGTKVKNAVITVPSYFDYLQIQATKQAAGFAGLNVMAVITESTAAVMAYGLDKNVAVGGRMVLVFDLGTDSCVISLVKIENNVSEVVSVCEDDSIGGQNFDTRLVKYFVGELKRKHGKDISENPRAMNRLRTACEKAKIMLSSTSKTTVVIDALFDGVDVHMFLSRALFCKLNSQLREYFVSLVDKCLKDANLWKEDVDVVIVVGEASRTPMIQQMLKDFFGMELCTGIHPNEVVACGAALHAATLSTHPKETDINTLLLKNVDSLLQEVVASKPVKILSSHLKSKVKDMLIRLKQDFLDTEQLQNLTLLLTEVDISLPEHLRPALRGLEQTLVACQHRLLEMTSERETTFIGPQQTTSILTASMKRIRASSSYCDKLKADIADVNATIDSLIEQRARLKSDLASQELKLERFTATLATEMDSAKARLDRVTSFQNAEKSVRLAVDCLGSFFESL
ncbi:hypothetical protein RND81_02G089500 [Saponaria officinalis]|uniref:Uncharacterized protein n=1 Tax=Saponaria officinalis TaxID=3572 RepID=A0AAW1MTE1_SAPOF